MERRLNTRYRGAGTVYLMTRGKRLRRFRIRNLSARGVFVESDTFSLPLDTAVELAFVVSTDNVIRLYHRKAIVAHRSKQGMGMLLHRDIGTRRKRTAGASS